MKNYYKLAPMIGGFVLAAVLNTAGIFSSEVALAAPDGKNTIVNQAKTTNQKNSITPTPKETKTTGSVKNLPSATVDPKAVAPKMNDEKAPAPGNSKLSSVKENKSAPKSETSSKQDKNDTAKSKNGLISDLEAALKSESLSEKEATQTPSDPSVASTVNDPVTGPVEDSMRDWQKTADWAKSFRTNELNYTVARIEGASDSSKLPGTVPGLPLGGSSSASPKSSAPDKSAPGTTKNPKYGTPIPGALPVPDNIPNRDVRKSFIDERPKSLDSIPGNSISSSPSHSSGSALSADSVPSLGAPGTRGSFSAPISGQIPAVDYSGENIPKTKGTDIRIEAYVEIPKGEGYEALISANGQGLLVELGLAELDAQGKPVFTPDGKQKRRNLKKGMTVKKGDDLGKQNDREQAANKIVAEEQLVVAKKEAEKILEIEVAELAATVAQSEYYRAQDANRKMPGAVTPEEVVQRAYEWKRADKSAEKAKYDLEVKQDEVKVRKAQVTAADAQVLDRKLISPIDGIIDDVMQNEGQWMREGDNILKIIRLDKVQISGKVDARFYSPKMVDGKEVTVYVQQPGSKLREMKGKVSYARQIVESGWYYVYAEVENINEGGYWVLMPGTLVTMDIHR